MPSSSTLRFRWCWWDGTSVRCYLQNDNRSTDNASSDSQCIVTSAIPSVIGEAVLSCAHYILDTCVSCEEAKYSTGLGASAVQVIERFRRGFVIHHAKH